MSTLTGICVTAAAAVPPAPHLEVIPGSGVPGRESGAATGGAAQVRPRPRAAAAPAVMELSAGAGGNAAGAWRSVEDHREVCAISRSTVQAAIEVLAGTRPAQQLSRRLDPRCVASLQHRAALTRRAGTGGSRTAALLHRNPSVRSVHACRVSEHIYEACAVVVEEARIRAVALRIERSRAVWRVTVLEIG